MPAESIHSSEDYRRVMAVAGLFKETFSIDWLVDLLTEKKPSQILAQLEGLLLLNINGKQAKVLEPAEEPVG